jgi:hypothetical protein
MKKLLVLILVVAAGYMVYQKFVVGSLSDEQKLVQALAAEFSAARQQMAQAERSAGVSGMDTTGDIDSVNGMVEALLAKLQEAKEGLTEAKAQEAAGKLEIEMRAFLDRKQ